MVLKLSQCLKQLCCNVEIDGLSNRDHSSVHKTRPHVYHVYPVMNIHESYVMFLMNIQYV
jgi:TFIIF-interacting CTD phosphatase-like protein